MQSDIFAEFFGKETMAQFGVDDKEYRCVSCSYPLTKIVVEEMLTKKPRKLFYCKTKKCVRFGIVTVVAK